ncbi:MAG TPA: AsmA-like C-terminal region-containing protein, partial [Gammaproteobacteria bacterium]|nr:AsmA-like C-terminal region-containing protein [Gammaproteobacteria bacterium]
VAEPAQAAALLERGRAGKPLRHALARSYLHAGFRYSGERGALRGLEGSLAGIHLRGNLKGRGLAGDRPVLEGDLRVRVDRGREVAGLLPAGLADRIRVPGLEGGRLSAHVAYRAGRDSLDVTGLKGNLGRLAFGGQGEMRGFSGGEYRYSGRFATERFPPRALAARLGMRIPAAADPGVLQQATLSFAFAGGPERLEVSRLRGTLDDSRLTGGLTVAASPRARLQWHLHLNGIDMDRYLGRRGTVKPWPGAAVVAGLPRLPPRVLRNWGLQGRLRVDELRSGGMRLSRLQASLAGDRGHLRIHPLRARLYDGTYRGDLRLDASGKTPRFSAREAVRGLHLAPLARDLTGRVGLTGTARLDLTYRGAGHSPRGILASLEGSGRYRLRDGEILGWNPATWIPGVPSTGGRKGRTPLHSVRGSLKIHQGRARSDDLEARSDLFRAKGRGFVDLVGERMDYRLRLALRKDAEGVPGFLKGVALPIRVHGPLDNPDVNIRLGP